MTKNETPAPSGAKVQDPEGDGKPQSALPSDVSREAVVAFTLGEIARVGVGMGRVRLWLSGHSQELHDVDLGAFDAAVALVADVHRQVASSAGADPAPLPQYLPGFITVPGPYARLADLIGVRFDPNEIGSVIRVVRRCVAKLEHDLLRKG